MGFAQFPSGKPRVSRGDVRIAILRLLAEEPMHGYQIIQEITDRTDGVWQPSPGSIYPTLQQLEDEGLVRAEQSDGKNSKKQVLHIPHITSLPFRSGGHATISRF